MGIYWESGRGQTKKNRFKIQFIVDLILRFLRITQTYLNILINRCFVPLILNEGLTTQQQN